MLEFAVVAEAQIDARLACALADRILIEEGYDWIDANLLPHLRNWSGLEAGTAFTRWASIPQLFKRFPRSRVRRSPATQPIKPDYAAGRKAIILAAILQDKRPDALLLVRDLDHQAERREGLAQARTDEAIGSVVILATPNPKREAWVLNGFVCQTRREEEELEAIRQEINFHPCQEAHRLRYTSQTSKPERDPKKILERLTGNNGEREAQCWLETPLAILREHGVETHLKEFLDEVTDRLLPLFSK
jgi:hypothetical protein